MREPRDNSRVDGSEGLLDMLQELLSVELNKGSCDHPLVEVRLSDGPHLLDSCNQQTTNAVSNTERER